MDANRTYVAENGDKVEEYYWAGKIVCYVNNHLTDKTFNQMVDYYEHPELLTK